jgi:polyisoprenyl-teichoic acid--peptidoglycan teichoic acid transferase
MSEKLRRDAPPAKRPSRPSLRNQILMVFGILVLATGAFYTALVVVTQVDHIFFPDSEIRLSGLPSVLPGIDSEGTSGQQGRVDDRRMNILVMGLDARPSDGDAPPRTDTMFVMTIDSVTNSSRGLAIPRDLWVEIPLSEDEDADYIEDRVNTAYAYGVNGDLPGGGTGTVIRTVERLLEIDIHHYVMIDFEGFREIVNTLGGITVFVEEPGVYDPYYSETELPGDYYPCIFDPGEHHMDGSEALCYSRVRNMSNDLDRILRQQRVILAMVDRASELNFLSSPDTLVSLWQDYRNTITTDISDLQAPGYARLATRIDQDSLSFLTLGAVATPWTTPAGAQVLLPSHEGVRQLVEAFVSDRQLQDEDAIIQVQNGTDIEGEAARAASFFVEMGIAEDHISTGNATAPAELTEIIVFNGKDYTATRIASWLGVSTDRIRPATAEEEIMRTPDVDIIVVLGNDLDAAAYTP